MTSETEEQRLRRLETRIAEMRKSQEPGPRKDEHYSLANQAWRMVIELVAGLVIGFGIGYGLDALFGTSPFLLVLFILLGFAAGVNVMLRTARELQRNQADQSAEDDKRG
jgi:ATP synthase protein I